MSLIPFPDSVFIDNFMHDLFTLFPVQDQRRLGAVVVPNKEEALKAAKKLSIVDPDATELSKEALTNLLYEELRIWYAIRTIMLHSKKHYRKNYPIYTSVLNQFCVINAADIITGPQSASFKWDQF